MIITHLVKMFQTSHKSDGVIYPIETVLFFIKERVYESGKQYSRIERLQ